MTIVSALKSDLKVNDSRDSLTDRVVGAYIGLAIGDALGATTEFMTPAEIQHQYGVHNQITGGGWLRLKPGQVTDDTTMSLALGDSIIKQNGVRSEAVAQAFSDWMKSKPIDIGNTVRRGIIHYRTSGEFTVKPNEYDAGNGACMRCLPVAIFYHDYPLADTLEAVRKQSHVTHNNPVSDAGTETIIRLLIAAFNGQSKDDLKYLVDQLTVEFPEFRYQGKRIENPSGWIVETLKAVFQAFFGNDGFEDAMTDVVNRGGDSDTTGAILGMLAGAHFGYSELPVRWKESLDASIAGNCHRQALDLMKNATDNEV